MVRTDRRSILKVDQLPHLKNWMRAVFVYNQVYEFRPQSVPPPAGR
jgi:hypothetical protein